MLKTRKVVVFAIIFLLVLVSSAFALDVKQLNQEMWTWSQLSEVLHSATHGHGTPVVSPQEAEKCIAEAKAKITAMVTEIDTLAQMKEARAVAAEFESMGGFEEEVGTELNAMLDEREKFIKAHQN